MKMYATLILLVFMLNGATAKVAPSTAGGVACRTGHNTGVCSETQQVASLTSLPASLRGASELPSSSLNTATPAATAEAPSSESNIYVLMLVGVALMTFVARRRLD